MSKPAPIQHSTKVFIRPETRDRLRKILERRKEGADGTRYDGSGRALQRESMASIMHELVCSEYDSVFGKKGKS